MNIRKIVMSTMVGASLMFVGLNAFADQAPHAKMDPHAMAMKLQKDLKLSDEQAAKIETIFKDTHDEAEKLRDELMQLKTETDDKIKAELTPEQTKKFEDKQNKRHEKRHHKRMKNQQS